jgi:hypothetical protein
MLGLILNVEVRHPQKKYEFEYWGSKYYWKRVIEKRDRTKDSYPLLSTTAIAHIVANVLTASEALKNKQDSY